MSEEETKRILLGIYLHLVVVEYHGLYSGWPALGNLSHVEQWQIENLYPKECKEIMDQWYPHHEVVVMTEKEWEEFNL